MTAPQLNEDELWERVRQLYSTQAEFASVAHGHTYTINRLDERNRCYVVRYHNEKKREESIPIAELFRVYSELYRVGRMPRDYIKKNGKAILGHARYSGSPGATIYAILPSLDHDIHVAKEKVSGAKRETHWLVVRAAPFEPPSSSNEGGN